MKTRRAFLITLAACAAAPAAADLFELETSLTDRAKFKSFGVRNWVTYDPTELQRGQPKPDEADWRGSRSSGVVGGILDLIAFAEAGPKGYDAVHFNAKRRPPARPTQLTVGQIQKWARTTRGQPHAIGRYQFIPKTLNRLVKLTKTPKSARFSPALQDKLATVLLVSAGHTDFTSGKISLGRYMDNLTKVWAGLPLKNGRSYYHKYAGNRATISHTFYLREMKRITG
jgi:hypothetical protein